VTETEKLLEEQRLRLVGAMAILALPEAVLVEVKAYFDNRARGWFPKPKSICLEDLDEACKPFGIGYSGSSGTFWFVFPQTYGIPGEGGDYCRCMVVNESYPTGKETQATRLRGERGGR
jgi:hypothetical protein